MTTISNISNVLGDYMLKGWVNRVYAALKLPLSLFARSWQISLVRLQDALSLLCALREAEPPLLRFVQVAVGTCKVLLLLFKPLIIVHIFFIRNPSTRHWTCFIQSFIGITHLTIINSSYGDIWSAEFSNICSPSRNCRNEASSRTIW